LARVAIVGRPNVGKSSLFNRLAGQRIAAVEDVPVVTRDRLYASALAMDRDYVLIDTGGFDPESDDPLTQNIARQIEIALAEADVILCVFDGSVDPLPADQKALALLRGRGKPVLYVANKVDSPRKAQQALELYRLGVDELIMISALHDLGVGDLEEALAAALPAPREIDSPWDPSLPRIALVGRPNAGKSSLANRLLGEERQTVDDRPGTTVDSVDALLDWEDRRCVLIDTAGIRRKRSVKASVESIAVLQAIRSVERSDAVLLLIDAEAGPAEQDTKIASLALDRGCAIVVALNKSDRLSKDARKAVEERTRDVLHFMPWVPIHHVSARTGRGVRTLMQAVFRGVEAHAKRIPTGEVNRFFDEVLEHHPPPTQGGRPVRLYYITQVSVRPPTFVAMANDPTRVHPSYRRYVTNQLRNRFDFEGTPVRVIYRN
jgi:GTPase